MARTLKEEYFHWLYNQIKPRRTYYKLCGFLHTRAFRWSVNNDDNRYQDGLDLRDRFLQQTGMDENHTEVKYFLKGDCTIFEFLVALSHRINELMYDLNSTEDKSGKWFLEMLTNLGLNVYLDNYELNSEFSSVTESKIDDIVEKLVSRNYDYHGFGGLFPLKMMPEKDQSKVEIWYQLMLYLDENYGL